MERETSRQRVGAVEKKKKQKRKYTPRTPLCRGMYVFLPLLIRFSTFFSVCGWLHVYQRARKESNIQVQIQVISGIFSCSSLHINHSRRQCCCHLQMGTNQDRFEMSVPKQLPRHLSPLDLPRVPLPL